MLTFGITLTPTTSGHSAKGCALMFDFRHKQSTFPLTFSTSPLIYYTVEILREKHHAESSSNTVINQIYSVYVRIDKDVIQISYYEIIQELHQGIIHEVLKSEWSISQSKTHN